MNNAKGRMPWLRVRLAQIDASPTDLAAHLGIAPPRVWEMIAGRRAIQPSEIVPLSRFLGWSIHELVERLPAGARFLPAEMCLRPKNAVEHLRILKGLIARGAQ